jgi:hypothetical protein
MGMGRSSEGGKSSQALHIARKTCLQEQHFEYKIGNLIVYTNIDLKVPFCNVM